MVVQPRRFHWCNFQSQQLTSSLPSARSSAVSSSIFRSIVSAPDWQRTWAMAASCLPTARCRGVQPLNMAPSTLAPLLSSNFTDVMSCSSTARWRAVLPLVPSCERCRWKTVMFRHSRAIQMGQYYIVGTFHFNNSVLIRKTRRRNDCIWQSDKSGWWLKLRGMSGVASGPTTMFPSINRKLRVAGQPSLIISQI